MTMPSPFEMGRAVGGNISRGLEGGREQSAISQVLAEIASDKDPIAGQNKMNQLLLNISPERREIASQLLGQQVNQLKTQQIQQQHDAIAKSFLNDFPDDPKMQIAARVLAMNIPPEQKPVMIKSLLGSSPYMAEQQKRLDRESIRKVYDNRIKQLQQSLKSLTDSNATPQEESLVREQIKSLQDQEDTALGIINMKVKFDPNNENHKSRRDQILKSVNGDRKKAGEILSKDFEL